ncbi:MAG TPA: carboxypeptidase regulatory-like domain-containing protein [Polyangiaceae bacterium]
MLLGRPLVAPTLAAAVLAASHLAAAAEPEAPTEVGDAGDGLPGVVRTPIVGVAAPRLALALDAGYGFTEAQKNEGAHHRLIGQVGVGLAPLEWLELGVRALGRHDRHPDDGLGSDSGTTTDVALLARAGRDVGSGVRVGADLGARFPGSESAKDSLTSPALDARLLLGWMRSGGVRVAGFAGYRIDQTAGVAEDSERYRLGDRLALGASEFDAVLVGVGAILPVATAELLAEVSGDVLVGSGAPEFSESPLRASVGARVGVGDAAAVSLQSDISLSRRPELAPDSALIPIEPRFSILAGFRYRFWDGPELERAPKAAAPPKPSPKVGASPPKPVATPPPAPTNTVRVTVVDKTAGHPLSDAEAEIIVGGQVRPLRFVTESTFEIGEIPTGSAELVVRAERLKDWRQQIQISEGEPLEVRVEMIPAANSGQIRGLVRGFDGKGLQARISIEPGAHAVRSDADGSFRVDVPPGNYRVEIAVEGYRTQKLPARVGKDGVIVLNVDMLKEAP